MDDTTSTDTNSTDLVAVPTETESVDETPRSTGPNYVERIKRALDLAENAATEAERDHANAVAQRLMQRYAISEAMIAGARRAADSTPDEIAVELFTFSGVHGSNFMTLLKTVSHAYGGYTVQSKRTRRVDGKTRTKTQHELLLEVAAYSRDLERIKMLYTSLSLQVATAKTTWETEWVAEYTRDHGFRPTRWQLHRDRREFLSSFASGVHTKLYAAQREATAEAVKERAAETHTAKSEVREGIELALRSRRDSVKDWMDNRYGNSLRNVAASRHSSGSGSANAAGYSAGRSADTGSAPSIPTGPRAITSS